jgi:hypothetical protein
MRNVLVSVLLFLLTTVHASPSNFAGFIKAFQEEATLEGNDTLPAGELLKRQSGCASGYNACAGIGAPGLCCGSDSVCSADAAGHVACCPLNAACTGTIGGGVQATVTATTTTSNSFVFATTTTTGDGGFYVGTATASAQGASTASNARSTVSNPYYPFAFIPTTYTNAAACSSAYTSCQTDVSSCNAALTGGIHGVTVSAPNGGLTVAAITGTLDAAAASQVCQSLSSQACFGLQVAACASFGSGQGNNARRNGCGNIYGMAAGVAIGVAGELLR